MSQNWTEAFVWPHTNIRTTGFTWTLGSGGTNEYYVDDGAGASPALAPSTTLMSAVEPPAVEANAIELTAGAVGALAVSEWDWADNDTLGFMTIYVRLADEADPDSKADGFVTSGGDDTSAGTSDAAAKKTLQDAIDNIGPTAEGDRFNVKDTGPDVLASSLSLASYGTPSLESPIFVQGYKTTAGDGGVGDLDGDDGDFAIGFAVADDFFNFRDMVLHNTGTAGVIQGDNNFTLYHCEVADGGGDGINGDINIAVHNCFIHDIGGDGVEINDGSVLFNYFKNDGTRDMVACLRYVNGNANQFCNFAWNVCNIDGVTDGVIGDTRLAVFHNSIYSNGGTGTGIDLLTGDWYPVVADNLIEGFSGTGGIGIQLASGGQIGIYAGNSAFDCTTEFSINDSVVRDRVNETLGSSPFGDPGSENFAPAPVGLVNTAFLQQIGADGAIGGTSYLWRGALQPSVSAAVTISLSSRGTAIRR